MKFVNGFSYLIEEDFECEDFLSKNYNSIINYYLRTSREEGKVDANANDTPLSNYFTIKIKNLIRDIFVVDNTNIDVTLNLYIQNHQNNTFSYHNHIHQPSSICGVFYTKIPKNGGELNIFHPPVHHIDNPLSFKPQINKIYFFPSWLYHSPTPQEDEEYRVCINFAYSTHTRPIVKNYGIVW